MKLVKLSLAAIVAAGAMTTYASAQPLEEAIKNIEIDGMARYRYNGSNKDFYNSDSTKEMNRFSGVINISSQIAENLTFGTSIALDHENYSRQSASSPGSTFVDKFWFQYAINDFTIKLGKIEIPTPWTQSEDIEGTRGNGILGLYSGLEGWTFAAAYFLQTDRMNDVNIPIGSSSAGWTLGSVGDLDSYGQEDLMAAGAIGSVGPVDMQVWAARMQSVIDYTVFGEVGFEMAGFNIKGQVNYLKLDSDLKTVLGYSDDKGIFFGIEGGYAGEITDDFGIFASLGYTKTDDDMPIYVLDGDNDGFIKFGQQLYLSTQNNPDTQVIFGVVGGNYKKLGFELGYGMSDVNEKDYDANEFYGLISYDLTKNLSLSAYYSILSGDANVNNNNELQLEIQYNF